jgi:hypothetical protein
MDASPVGDVICLRAIPLILRLGSAELAVPQVSASAGAVSGPPCVSVKPTETWPPPILGDVPVCSVCQEKAEKLSA